MGQVARFVGIRVEVIARKLVAIAANFHPLVPGAFIGRTTMRFTEDMLLQWYLAVVWAAPTAKHNFHRHVVFLSQFLHYAHCLLVLRARKK